MPTQYHSLCLIMTTYRFPSETWSCFVLFSFCFFFKKKKRQRFKCQTWNAILFSLWAQKRSLKWLSDSDPELSSQWPNQDPESISPKWKKKSSCWPCGVRQGSSEKLKWMTNMRAEGQLGGRTEAWTDWRMGGQTDWRMDRSTNGRIKRSTDRRADWSTDPEN